MKYLETAVVFREVPNEVTLAINISGCQIRCKDCHSKYLWEDKGEELSVEVLSSLIINNSGISCVCFMGGDHCFSELKFLCKEIKHKFPKLKVAWYSGKQSLTNTSILEYLDYIKLGPYNKEFGPLDSPHTNQRFYEVIHTPSSNLLSDITSLFNNKKR